ncbi:pituitary tumor-transforming gene 1 protein-interacting protein [Denticeps clupeoides]|uniref:Pituitary tumor-transforming gene 1 protein-interacting protein-like n=1 Tax=Denticeps clupeoides TaxID=299321 RepID=A0AAY4AEQ9_9TELE|nr:pituitary tumor-transforming gene 1 protein-interacting protein-like [Denticeps clupeoides]
MPQLFAFLFVLLCAVRGAASASAGFSTASPAARPCDGQSSCEDCLANVNCLWCDSNQTCTKYPLSYILPPSSVCPLAKAHWGVCWVNFEALVIAMAVLGGTIGLSITVCCCCCFCRRSSSGYDREESSITRRREEARQRQQERKAERMSRHDDIRKKYGLVPDSDHPYSKFENE